MNRHDHHWPHALLTCILSFNYSNEGNDGTDGGAHGGGGGMSTARKRELKAKMQAIGACRCLCPAYHVPQLLCISSPGGSCTTYTSHSSISISLHLHHFTTTCQLASDGAYFPEGHNQQVLGVKCSSNNSLALCQKYALHQEMAVCVTVSLAHCCSCIKPPQ